MEFKARFTIQYTLDLDTEHFEANTPEACVTEQQKALDDGEADAIDFINFEGDYQEKVELVK